MQINDDVCHKQYAKGKNVDNYTQTQLKTGIKTFYAMQKVVRSMKKKNKRKKKKQPSCKNRCGPKNSG